MSETAACYTIYQAMTKVKTKSKERYTVGGLLVISLLIIGAVSYANRGAIRQELIPSFIERKHAPKIDKVFDARMTPMIEQLKQHELIHSYETTALTRCSTTVYSWLREDVGCDRTTHIETQIVDESLKSKWREATPDFYEKNLVINGWLFERSGTHADAASQLGTLLDEPNRSISFRNEQADVTCSISFNQVHLFRPVYLSALKRIISSRDSQIV